jgi:hypothetical protein
MSRLMPWKPIGCPRDGAGDSKKAPPRGGASTKGEIASRVCRGYRSCPACQTVGEVGSWILDRQPMMPVSGLMASLSCRRCCATRHKSNAVIKPGHRNVGDRVPGLS